MAIATGYFLYEGPKKRSILRFVVRFAAHYAAGYCSFDAIHALGELFPRVSFVSQEFFAYLLILLLCLMPLLYSCCIYAIAHYGMPRRSDARQAKRAIFFRPLLPFSLGACLALDARLVC
jgi:hypothetical protein